MIRKSSIVDALLMMLYRQEINVAPIFYRKYNFDLAFLWALEVA
tara:strand:- start:420 stop:551 length:132 start_codon:yes stop_codon:yes gene_type:complete